MKTKLFHSFFLVLPCLIFACFINLFAVNVPWFDDIEVFVNFLSKYEKTTSLQGKLTSLLRPNNEHRMFHGKLLNVLVAQWKGHLSVRTDILISSFSIFGILFLLVKNQMQANWQILYLFPIALFLLHPQYHLTSLWAITSLQTQSVLFFGILGLWFIIKDQNWAFGIGILLLTYSSFSMSNGMFFFLAAAILLLLQKKYKHLFITLMSFSIVVYGYFYGFEASANDEGFAFFKQNPELSFIGFFAHLGASLDFIPSQSLTKRVLICGVSGFLIFITILAWVAKGYSIKINPLTFLQNRFSSKQRLFILGIIIFLFTNAVVLAILRSRFGFNVLIIGNYRLYTSLVLVCAYICFVDLLNIKPQNLLFKGVFCFAILFWIASYAVYLPEVIERRKDLIVRAFNQKYNRIGLGAYHGTFLQKYIADSFRDLPANTPYQYPISDIFSEDDLRKIQSTATAADVLTIELSQETVNGEICLTNLSLKNEIGLNDGLFLILQSETNTYLHYQKRSLKEFIRGYGLFTCLDEKNFKPDDYDLFLLQKTDNTSKLYDMQSRIRIK